MPVNPRREERTLPAAAPPLSFRQFQDHAQSVSTPAPKASIEPRSLAPWTRAEYERLKKAGAYSYILKHEAADPELYEEVKFETLDQRLGCMYDLLDCGFKVGTGSIIGLRGQTLDHIADEVVLAKILGAHMVRPRSLVIDELKRHLHTDQVFIPVAVSFLAVVGSSLSADVENPDPAFLNVNPVAPGEAINIKDGTWHTLPFAMVHEIVCVSVMRREDVDNYHYLRDLAAAGGVALPTWRDLECIH